MNSVPSQNDGFILVKSKKMNSTQRPYSQKYHKYINKHDALSGYWGDPKGWIKHYHCNACHGLMTKKEPTRRPQVIYSCGCIVCASCIAQSYFVKLNPKCPAGCGKLVDPSSPNLAPPLILGSSIVEETKECDKPVTNTVSEPVIEFSDEDKFINELVKTWGDLSFTTEENNQLWNWK
jgi:hypothetical protein